MSSKEVQGEGEEFKTVLQPCNDFIAMIHCNSFIVMATLQWFPAVPFAYNYKQDYHLSRERKISACSRGLLSL